MSAGGGGRKDPCALCTTTPSYRISHYIPSFVSGHTVRSAFRDFRYWRSYPAAVSSTSCSLMHLVVCFPHTTVICASRCLSATCVRDSQKCSSMLCWMLRNFVLAHNCTSAIWMRTSGGSCPPPPGALDQAPELPYMDCFVVDHNVVRTQT